MLPRGTPHFVIGTTAPATISLLSGIAFAAILGATRTKSKQSFVYIYEKVHNKGAHYCYYFYNSQLVIQPLTCLMNLTTQRLTQSCATSVRRFQPAYFVSRRPFQEAVPNSEPIGVTTGLKLDKYLNHVHIVKMRATVFRSHLTNKTNFNRIICDAKLPPTGVFALSVFRISSHNSALRLVWKHLKKSF